MQPPPILYVKPIKAETIIVAVGACLLGWFKSNLSEIAAVRQFPDNIVKDRNGRLAYSTDEPLAINRALTV